MTQLWQIMVRVPQTQAEHFAALYEEEALAVSVQRPPRQAMAQIEAIYAAEPDDAAVRARLREASVALQYPAPELQIIALPQTDWLRQVALATPPRRIGRLMVHTAQDKNAVPRYVPSLQIESATAFGTGEHPSTQMCLLLLQQLLRRSRPRRVLDVGCGSGILALAAARLGQCQALGVDCDAESVRLTRHNAQVNGLASQLTALQGHGYQPRLVGGGRLYDLIFANIFARPLMLLAADLRAHLAPGGYAILAGLLTTQVPMVLAAHRMQRLHLVAKLSAGEWSALLLKKRSG